MTNTKLITLNDMVAIKPIKPPEASAEPLNPRTRVAISSKMTGELVQSEVMFDGPGDIKKNDVAYFTVDIYNYPGTRKVLSIDNQEFVLVPKTMIVAKSSGGMA